MAILFDMHLHTRRHSPCSTIDEYALIPQAVKAGLQGLVITEHHYQWPREELDELLDASGERGFLLFAGFEYSSSKGDILIYGLDSDEVDRFEPFGDPAETLAKAQAMGAFCFAAHPTRAEVPFDERILTMPFDGIETRSVNMQPHEQRMAEKLAAGLGIPATASSDAHRLADIGAHALAFENTIQRMEDLRHGVSHGRFRIANPKSER